MDAYRISNMTSAELGAIPEEIKRRYMREINVKLRLAGVGREDRIILRRAEYLLVRASCSPSK